MGAYKNQVLDDEFAKDSIREGKKLTTRCEFKGCDKITYITIKVSENADGQDAGGHPMRVCEGHYELMEKHRHDE